MQKHNLYDASHAEYGYIVQDKTFVNRLYNQYYNNLKNEEESRDLGQSQVRH